MKISKMSSSKAFSLPIVYKIRFFRVLVVHVMHYCINYMLSRGIVCERGYTIYCTGMISSHHVHKLVIYAIKTNNKDKSSFTRLLYEFHFSIQWFFDITMQAYSQNEIKRQKYISQHKGYSMQDSFIQYFIVPGIVFSA